MINLKRHVVQLVQNTIRKYASTGNPNLFDEVCANLGLDMKETELPSRIDGMLEGKTILINSKIQSEERKRFTQFHEIMHHILKDDEDLIAALTEHVYNQDGEYDRQLEKFCNIGAAEFLMPSEEFRKLYEQKGFNVELILYAAHYFKSSTIAATIQLAQVAPNKCITAICEFATNGSISPETNLFNEKYRSAKSRLHVTYSAMSPTAKYPLAKNTVIPNDHLIHDAFLEGNAVEGKSWVPFRSGKNMPCHCEALADSERVYVLLHLSPPRTSTDQKQMKLFCLS